MECSESSLALSLLELLGESCLIPALSSYLRNDSGLYMCLATANIISPVTVIFLNSEFTVV